MPLSLQTKPLWWSEQLRFNEVTMKLSPYSYTALSHSTFIPQTFAEHPLHARLWAKRNKDKFLKIQSFPLRSPQWESLLVNNYLTQNGKGIKKVRKRTVDKQRRRHLNGGGEGRNIPVKPHRKVTSEEHLEVCLPFSWKSN